ncbi:uncharacterized protein CLUP02_11200 [Colletotrichum lupini]|uniref:Uncharacterized protein n=1 Tax=Colletotrichum lupini TaxID=145971 RepID=A0A9Q8WJL1_9PEZI|nr:uncharacterized protein CLUP02_11200 [Colletotrichum lupini]UQC85701.1 hypothetical protein CLUP02_11200 [Colletotrichum lupini]
MFVKSTGRRARNSVNIVPILQPAEKRIGANAHGRKSGDKIGRIRPTVLKVVAGDLQIADDSADISPTKNSKAMNENQTPSSASTFGTKCTPQET